jgi:hypothetical protein
MNWLEEMRIQNPDHTAIVVTKCYVIMQQEEIFCFKSTHHEMYNRAVTAYFFTNAKSSARGMDQCRADVPVNMTILHINKAFALLFIFELK